MEILWIVGLFVVVVIVWYVAKFILKLTTRVVGCAVTTLVAIGILFLIYFFLFR